MSTEKAGTDFRSERTHTVVGVFHSIDAAQRAFDNLERENFSRREISFIASKAGTSEWHEPARPGAGAYAVETSNVASDAGIGAAVGGVGGLVLSLAALAIPGIGPVLAAGPLLAALGGAGLGAATGGLIGALSERGIPEEIAGHYAEGVRRGDVLIAVQASGDRASRASEILDESGAVDIDDRVSDWRKRGWTVHDTSATELSGGELRRERDYYSAAKEQAAEWSKLGSPVDRRRTSRIYSGEPPAGL